MSLLAKLDRLVYASRLDRVIFRKLRPRTFRWLPLLVIAAMVAGYAVMAKGMSSPHPSIRTVLLGGVLFWGAFMVALLLRLSGPRFMPTEGHPLDERELALKARAYAISGSLLAGFAMLGCFYMSTEGLLGLWYPHRYDWTNLGFGVQTLVMLLPTWIASWLEPRPSADLDD